MNLNKPKNKNKSDHNITIDNVPIENVDHIYLGYKIKFAKKIKVWK